MNTQSGTPADYIVNPKPERKDKSKSEKTIEEATRDRVKELGGWSVKWYPVIYGLPDRIIFAGKGRIFFAELKSAKKKPSKKQIQIHEKLRSLGFNVYAIDSLEKLESILKIEFEC